MERGMTLLVVDKENLSAPKEDLQEDLLYCHMCPEVSYSFEALAKHIKEVHWPRCRLCGKTFLRAHQLQQHYLEECVPKHSETFKCPLCEANPMIDHMNMSHPMEFSNSHSQSVDEKCETTVKRKRKQREKKIKPIKIKIAKKRGRPRKNAPKEDVAKQQLVPVVGIINSGKSSVRLSTEASIVGMSNFHTSAKQASVTNLNTTSFPSVTNLNTTSFPKSPENEVDLNTNSESMVRTIRIGESTIRLTNADGKSKSQVTKSTNWITTESITGGGSDRDGISAAQHCHSVKIDEPFIHDMLGRIYKSCAKPLNASDRGGEPWTPHIEETCEFNQVEQQGALRLVQSGVTIDGLLDHTSYPHDSNDISEPTSDVDMDCVASGDMSDYPKDSGDGISEPAAESKAGRSDEDGIASATQHCLSVKIDKPFIHEMLGRIYESYAKPKSRKPPNASDRGGEPSKESEVVCEFDQVEQQGALRLVQSGVTIDGLLDHTSYPHDSNDISEPTSDVDMDCVASGDVFQTSWSPPRGPTTRLDENVEVSVDNNNGSVERNANEEMFPCLLLTKNDGMETESERRVYSSHR